MDNLRKYLGEVQQVLARLPLAPVRQVIDVLHQARRHGSQVFILGNGGSAATASHFACDLAKGTIVPGEPRFRVVALTDSLPLFSALANDIGYESVFVEQLAALLRPGDVVIGISGSGNSLNVLHALSFARTTGATTIGFTGFDGGRLKEMVDICVLVPCSCMEQVEDAHLVLEHLICTSLRQEAASAKVPLEQTVELVAEDTDSGAWHFGSARHLGAK